MDNLHDSNEPVAWLIDNDYTTVFCGIAETHRNKGAKVEPLYTSPLASKPLTDEQIGMAFRKAFPVGSVVFTNGAIDFARAIEVAHGIKEKSA